MILPALLFVLQVADPVGGSADRDGRRVATSAGGPARHLVVVDAGHGGPDRGMKGTTTARQAVYEADITLAVARKLRAGLTARGIDVLMTRNVDTLIALRDR